MKQKFSQLSFVHVGDNMPPPMDHFDKNFDAIVDHTYSQAYGGVNIDDYSVYQLKDGKIVDRIAWYEENQLTLLPKQDRELAENLIEEYNMKQ